MKRKLLMGMVGGGRGAFIGAVHRMAAAMDGQIDLIGGAFSSDPTVSRASGADLHLAPGRCYGTYQEMIEKEAALPLGKKMDFISIVTPNHMHFAPVKLALESGFHVICDKPLAFNLKEAIELSKIVKKSGLLFCLTHSYTGYPMVKQARALSRSGELGAIRKIVVEYPQGWLASPVRLAVQKKASWRVDPKRSGAGGCVGDIGTHAENLSEYISGQRISELAVDITTFGEGRLDDDINVLLRFENGAKGILHASRISVGEENGLNIRIYGEKGAVEWHQIEPNTLLVKWHDKPAQIFRTAGVCLSKEAAAASRLPAGHTEGFIEAFANLYRNFSRHLQSVQEGVTPDPLACDYPTVEDGVRGMAFIEAVVASSKNNAKWTPL